MIRALKRFRKDYALLGEQAPCIEDGKEESLEKIFVRKNRNLL